MDSTASPPLTPVRQHVMSPIDTFASPQSSPSHSFRGPLTRRTSSFSSNHDRSPTTPRSRHRFSNASQLSAEFGTPIDREQGGLDNLADELDQLDETEAFDEGETDAVIHEEADKEEGARDSGIDVPYRESPRNQHNAARNFSKPFVAEQGSQPSEDHDENDRFSTDLEDLMTSINRMTSYTDASEDPLIPRTIAQMQDLGNQTALEAAAQRFTTSTNSMTAHLLSQSKSLQVLMQNLYPVFAYTLPLDPNMANELLPLVDVLQGEIPQPDIMPVQKLQKLNLETDEAVYALSQLTDTLQMGKQITAAAARHLRTTQHIVEELRREREKADLARHELAKSDWQDRISSQWCAGQCKDIVAGFEDQCQSLRGALEAGVK